jgi:AcrR family transcriptional regulator
MTAAPPVRPADDEPVLTPEHVLVPDRPAPGPLADLSELVPDGLATPAHIPPEVFAAALSTFLQGERLDMQSLAAQLGVSRSTLYRRAGHRGELLGEVVWYLTRRSIVPALQETAHLRGAERVCQTTERFMRGVHGQPAFHRLLEAEPEAALHILTSREGPVQGALVDATERLLLQEEARGSLVLGVDARSLAYTIVRIGESFLYADVIADDEPDLDAVVELVGRLLTEPPSRTGRFLRASAQLTPQGGVS